MGLYHEKRSELKASLQSELRQRAAAEHLAATPALDDLLHNKAEQLLDAFESLVQQRNGEAGSFMRGVWQSVAGSFIFAIILGVLALVISGSRQNLIDLLMSKLK